MPHLFPCFCCSGCTGEPLMGNDSQLNHCLGSSPACWCPRKERARREEKIRPSGGGPGQGMPQRKPCGCYQNPSPSSHQLEAAEDLPWMSQCQKMLSLPHHNITMLNKHHLCVRASLLDNIPSQLSVVQRQFTGIYLGQTKQPRRNQLYGRHRPHTKENQKYCLSTPPLSISSEWSLWASHPVHWARQESLSERVIKNDIIRYIFEQATTKTERQP